MNFTNGTSLIHAWAFGNELSGDAAYAEFYQKSLAAVRHVIGNPGAGVPFLIAPDAIGQRGMILKDDVDDGFAKCTLITQRNT